MEETPILVLNCNEINQNNYIDYLKDNRDFIISLLIENTQKILQFIQTPLKKNVF